MTYRAQRVAARILEVPIIFRDRRWASKMTADRRRGPAGGPPARWDDCAPRPRGGPDEAGEGPARPRPRPKPHPPRLRALRDPERAPATAGLPPRPSWGAFAPIHWPTSRSSSVLDLGADDPTAELPGLPVVGKRRLPITRLFSVGSADARPVPRARRRARQRAGRPAPSRIAGVAHAVAAPCPSGRGCRSWQRCSTSRPGSCPSCTSAHRRPASDSGCGPSSSAILAVMGGERRRPPARRRSCSASGRRASG